MGEKIEVDKEKFNELVNELADRRTEEEMKRIERQAMKDTFTDLLIKSSYFSAPVMALLGLYFTWKTGSVAVLVMFGGTAVLTILVAADLRRKIADSGDEM